MSAKNSRLPETTLTLKYKQFKDTNLNDSFFDSLKDDYEEFGQLAALRC